MDRNVNAICRSLAVTRRPVGIGKGDEGYTAAIAEGSNVEFPLLQSIAACNTSPLALRFTLTPQRRSTCVPAGLTHTSVARPRITVMEQDTPTRLGHPCQTLTEGERTARNRKTLTTITSRATNMTSLFRAWRSPPFAPDIRDPPFSPIGARLPRSRHATVGPFADFSYLRVHTGQYTYGTLAQSR